MFIMENDFQKAYIPSVDITNLNKAILTCNEVFSPLYGHESHTIVIIIFV